MQFNRWSLRCSWSIACRRCSNYIFILHLTLGFNILRKDNCKPRRETFKFGALVSYIRDFMGIYNAAEPPCNMVIITWHCMGCDSDKIQCRIEITQTRNPKNAPHALPSRTSYDVYLVRILEKNNHVINICDCFILYSFLLQSDSDSAITVSDWLNPLYQCQAYFIPHARCILSVIN